MRPHKLNKRTLPGFVGNKMCAKCKKKHKPIPSKHETPSPAGPTLGQRWPNIETTSRAYYCLALLLKTECVDPHIFCLKLNKYL